MSIHSLRHATLLFLLPLRAAAGPMLHYSFPAHSFTQIVVGVNR